MVSILFILRIASIISLFTIIILDQQSRAKLMRHLDLMEQQIDFIYKHTSNLRLAKSNSSNSQILGDINKPKIEVLIVDAPQPSFDGNTRASSLRQTIKKSTNSDKREN